MTISDSEILDLLKLGQKANYDVEAVNQLEHALQCATLAETAGRSQEMIVACLLHDVGHLLFHLKEKAVSLKLDDRHEERGASFLAARFGPAILEPIRLHVPAKRYLCFAIEGYWDSLSPASKHSLEWQGGTFLPAQAAEFIAQPYAKDAVQLRIWDDQAKVAGLSTPDLAHFGQIMAAC